MTGVVQWRQKEVIEAVKKRVADDMAIAVKVVAVDASGRLKAIDEPKFGRYYRWILAMHRLTSFVEVKAKEIVGRVGIPRGKKGGDYGFYIEMGSKTAAAHPWLRPALIHNLKKIVGILGGE